MFSKTLSTTALAAALLAAGLTQAAPAVAQSKLPAPVIAVVDVPKVLNQSSAGKVIITHREKQIEVLKAEAKKEETALRDAEQELRRQSGVLSGEALTEKRRAFEQQVAASQRKLQERQRGLEEGLSKALQQVQATMLTAAQEVAQEVGANTVLNSAQVVMFDPRMDITATVLERLNKTLPTVEVPGGSAAPAAKAQAKPAKK